MDTSVTGHGPVLKFSSSGFANGCTSSDVINAINALHVVFRGLAAGDIPHNESCRCCPRVLAPKHSRPSCACSELMTGYRHHTTGKKSRKDDSTDEIIWNASPVSDRASMALSTQFPQDSAGARPECAFACADDAI